MACLSCNLHLLFSLYQHCKELCEFSVVQLKLHFINCWSWNSYCYFNSFPSRGLSTTSFWFLGFLSLLSFYLSKESSLLSLISYSFFLCSISSIRTKARPPQFSVITSPSELVSLNCFQSAGEKKVLSGHDSDDVFLGLNCTLDATCYVDWLPVHYKRPWHICLRHGHLRYKWSSTPYRHPYVLFSVFLSLLTIFLVLFLLSSQVLETSPTAASH